MYPVLASDKIWTYPGNTREKLNRDYDQPIISY